MSLQKEVRYRSQEKDIEHIANSKIHRGSRLFCFISRLEGPLFVFKLHSDMNRFEF
jgi:hypothetical protein